MTETSGSGSPPPNIDGLFQGPCLTSGCLVLAHNNKCCCLCSLSSQQSRGCLLELLWCRRARRNRADKTLHSYDGKFARSTLLRFGAFLMCSRHVESHTYLFRQLLDALSKLIMRKHSENLLCGFQYQQMLIINILFPLKVKQTLFLHSTWRKFINIVLYSSLIPLDF